MIERARDGAELGPWTFQNWLRQSSQEDVPELHNASLMVCLQGDISALADPLVLRGDIVPLRYATSFHRAHVNPECPTVDAALKSVSIANDVVGKPFVISMRCLEIMDNVVEGAGLLRIAVRTVDLQLETGGGPSIVLPLRLDINAGIAVIVDLDINLQLKVCESFHEVEMVPSAGSDEDTIFDCKVAGATGLIRSPTFECSAIEDGNPAISSHFFGQLGNGDSRCCCQNSQCQQERSDTFHVSSFL